MRHKFAGRILPLIGILVGLYLSYIFNTLPQWVALHPQWFGEDTVLGELFAIAPTWPFWLALIIVFGGLVVIGIVSWREDKADEKERLENFERQCEQELKRQEMQHKQQCKKMVELARKLIPNLTETMTLYRGDSRN